MHHEYSRPSLIWTLTNQNSKKKYSYINIIIYKHTSNPWESNHRIWRDIKFANRKAVSKWSHTFLKSIENELVNVANWIMKYGTNININSVASPFYFITWDITFIYVLMILSYISCTQKFLNATNSLSFCSRFQLSLHTGWYFDFMIFWGKILHSRFPDIAASSSSVTKCKIFKTFCYQLMKTVWDLLGRLGERWISIFRDQNKDVKES